MSKQLAMRIKKALDKMNVDWIMYNAHKRVVRDYKGELIRGSGYGSHVWSGRLIDTMRPFRHGRGVWSIKMPLYGEALDHQRPHYVSLKPGRKITRWWIDKKGSIDRDKVWVKPRHFKKRGDRKAPYHMRDFWLIETNRIMKKFIGG